MATRHWRNSILIIEIICSSDRKMFPFIIHFRKLYLVWNLFISNNIHGNRNILQKQRFKSNLFNSSFTFSIPEIKKIKIIHKTRASCPVCARDPSSRCVSKRKAFETIPENSLLPIVVREREIASSRFTGNNGRSVAAVQRTKLNMQIDKVALEDPATFPSSVCSRSSSDSPRRDNWGWKAFRGCRLSSTSPGSY